MLRIMKQKTRAIVPVEEELSFKKRDKHNAPDSALTMVEGLMAPIASPINDARIVSHVPVSSKSSSSSSLNSSNSTISSAQHHGYYPQPLPCRGDSEAFHGIISPIELSSQDHHHVPKSSKTLGLKRSISMIVEDTGTSASGREAKRLRTSSGESTELVCDRESSAAPTSHWPRLLSTANDDSVLNPLHIFVRQQVEVFQATPDDLRQPAPGRRVPIERNQVGIRCIHCKNKTNRKRKKRAVCFPSSVERIYHSISDMKFAHFPCQEMPLELQEEFAVLKEESLVQVKPKKESGGTRKTSGTASTAQYYNASAQALGLVNRKGGIYSCHDSLSLMLTSPSIDAPPTSLDKPRSEYTMSCAAQSQANMLQDMKFGQYPTPIVLVDDRAALQDQVAVTKIQKTTCTSVAHAIGRLVDVAPKPVPATTKSPKETAKEPILHAIKTPQLGPDTQGTILASALDPQYLAPIHCFVRKHVEVFAATEQDLAAPAPGRKKPVLLGQVGLRCVHCASLPFKQRVKRAICFPPNVGGVYHAISNMKFDHFKLCKGMPQKAREEFEQASSDLLSSKEGKQAKDNTKSRPRVSNSTAQYYKDSAFRMGLCDTTEGIRFSEKGTPREAEGTDMDAVRHAEGMQALIIAATDAKVRAAHEQRSQQRAAV